MFPHSNTSHKEHISTLADNLIRRIRNFSVLDKHIKLIGRVRDLILDSHHQLNLMVSEIIEHQSTDTQSIEDSHHYFLLPSKLIKKIDVATKSVFLEIDKSQLEHMPEYYQPEIADGTQKLEQTNTTEIVNLQAQNTTLDSKVSESIAEEEIIRLLGEKVIVDRSKRKVGDVIVRKEVETRIVQVPVRYEKLIVEQVSPEHRQLAEINLGHEEISNIALTEVEQATVDVLDGNLTVSGDFNSPKIASLLLNAIALEKNHGCKKVRVTISVEDEERRQKYQEWFERTSIR
ncbi:DUF2382 domain-containing protein [Chlorogloeopsis fritschii PCC 9212]|uniref:DUF2382 domain-containing protein n=1 Tax=Chlorogloeopsis fritschii PCC 6912 TaxID=211165 RepID=A0A433MX60_CHLFR|nr:DUF2382 domain-containing protein [Chlorogloeopsis fritschii]RUR72673.1 hypothetical protein PCC6912_61390 [Chlorogloeopsis fritschii PCC 6912]